MLSGQGSTLFAGLSAGIGILVGIQLWLVSAALEALLSNEPSAVGPAFVVSICLFAINLGLFAHGRSFDKRWRASRQKEPGRSEGAS